MTDEFKTILAALKTVPGQKVLPTSRFASLKDWPLPAVVLDMENPIWSTMTEDGFLVDNNTRVSMIFHAPMNDDDPTVPMQKIENLVAASLIAIQKAFPSNELQVDLPVYGPIPFGKTQMADSLGFFLRITNGE